MRLSLLLALVLAAAPAKPDLWRRIHSIPDPPDARLSAGEVSAIEALVFHQNGGWNCDSSDPEGKWRKLLHYRPVAAAAKRRTILVEADEGCTRAPHEINGAMWLIDLTTGPPAMLATPKGGFDGRLIAVQPHLSFGYRDLVVAWYLSEEEEGWTYLRFDGKAYKAIGRATYMVEGGKVIPEPLDPK